MCRLSLEDHRPAGAGVWKAQFCFLQALLRQKALRPFGSTLPAYAQVWTLKPRALPWTCPMGISCPNGGACELKGPNGKFSTTRTILTQSRLKKAGF